MTTSRRGSILDLSFSIRSRIWLLATVAIAGLVVVGAFVWTGNRGLDAAIVRRDAYAALATAVRDLRSDALRLRATAIELAGDHNKLTADRFLAEIRGAHGDVERLRTLPLAETVAKEIGELDRLIGEATALFEPLRASLEAIGHTQIGRAHV
jgi:hypothetical protein